MNVTWEITEACNLACSHCLSADLRAPARGELDRDRCFAVIDELARMQVFQVNFGGGEPFLRDDFLDILEYAHEQGITTCVSTNGTLLDADLVDELLCLSAPVYLQVSLDGAVAATNDAIRGAGTFGRILRGIELLAERGYPDFSLNMVVTRVNAGELADFHKLARLCGARTRLSRFRPSGAGCGRWEEYRLSREQLLELSVFLGRSPRDRHRRLVLRARAGQPARAGAAQVRRGQDDLRHRTRRQRLSMRLLVRPGVPRRERHR